MITWNATKEEFETIVKIVERAEAMELPIDNRRMNNLMDIEACHCNGCPLQLDDLLNADDIDFAHDVVGIYVHIDRNTGKLEDYFVPRCAK